MWCSTATLSRPVHPAMMRVVISMRRSAPSTRNSMRCRAPPLRPAILQGLEVPQAADPSYGKFPLQSVVRRSRFFHPTEPSGNRLMSKFVISPHFRLQEWVAEEKGYFKAEGLDYEFRDNYGPGDVGKKHATPDKIGAYQSIEQGRACDVSGACHWTVNVAASAGHGKLYADAYSVAPCGVFVPPESDIEHPSELKGVPISVGYQSGSHYSTIQGLEQYMGLDDIKLSFADGLLFSRLEKLIDRKVPAASLFSGPYYFLEQLGFRKVIDTTFMMATSITGDPDPEDLRKYFRALRKAQRDIDLRPELYTHYYRKEFPARFLEQMDTRRWGPGERIVFEPYTKEVFEESFRWIAERRIFAEGDMGPGKYEDSVISLAA